MLILLFAINTLKASLLDECLEDSAQEKCALVKLPDEQALASVEGLCRHMPNMPGDSS